MQGRSTIKSNPLLETYRVALLFMGIAAALALLLAVLAVIMILVGGHATHAVNAFPIDLIDLPVWVLALVSFYLLYRYWKRIERCRLAAAEGDHALLAEEAMKALCQLIAAQTRLPLYDLRTERTNE